KNPRDLARKIAELGPDKEVALGIIRDGKAQTINLKLSRLADETVRTTYSENGSSRKLRSLGLTVAPAAEIESTGAAGLAVVGVDPNGKAAELGFQQGDIILKAGNKTISRAEDLRTAMSEAAAAGHKNTLVMIKRDQAQHYVAVPVAVS